MQEMRLKMRKLPSRDLRMPRPYLGCVNPVNRLTKIAKNGQNTDFLRMARPRQQPQGGCVWGENVAPGGSGSPFVSSLIGDN